MSRMKIRHIFGMAFLILAMIAGTRPLAAQQVNWMSFEEAVERSKEEKKKIFIDVYTDWCGWCKHIDTTVLNLPEAEQFFTDEMLLVRKNFVSLKESS